MKRLALLTGAILVAAVPAFAQDPLTKATKQTHDMIKGNIVKSAEKMSEADYAFKPVDGVRTFGELVGHVANANYMICASGTGMTNPNQGTNLEKTATSKAALQKALAESFDFCDKAYASMDDKKGMETTKFFTGEQPRIAVLAFNNAHNMEHYGNMVTYLRIKGIVPPSSERSQ